jgi:O-antigen/teichoic acid export membrane protein
MLRKSKNLQNSGWNLANILIYPIAFLAATPFFINKLGESVFGEWMLINSYVFISVHLVGFGLPESITAHVAEALGKKSNSLLYAYINGASRLLLQFSMITLVVAIVMVIFYLTDHYFFTIYIWKTLIMATFLIVFKFPEVLFQSIFKGYEKYNFAALFNMMNKFIALVAQVILVMLNFSLLEIFTANLSILIFTLIIQGVFVYRGLTNYHFVLFKRLPERKALYHFGFWNWLQTIIDITANQLDRFIVAYFLGTATVTYYVLAATIANHLHMAFQAAVGWLFPKVSRLKASLTDTRAYFHTIRTFSIGFSLLVLIILYLVNQPLLTVWLGPGKYQKIASFFELFIIFESFLILSIVPKLYLNGIKSLQFITSLELMFKSAIIIGMIIAFSLFNSGESLVWGQILALIIFMPVEYFLVNRKILKEDPVRETLTTILPSLSICAAILSTGWIWTLAFIILAILLFWRIYYRNKHFDYHLLVE